MNSLQCFKESKYPIKKCDSVSGNTLRFSNVIFNVLSATDLWVNWPFQATCDYLFIVKYWLLNFTSWVLQDGSRNALHQKRCIFCVYNELMNVTVRTRTPYMTIYCAALFNSVHISFFVFKNVIFLSRYFDVFLFICSFFNCKRQSSDSNLVLFVEKNGYQRYNLVVSLVQSNLCMVVWWN